MNPNEKVIKRAENYLKGYGIDLSLYSRNEEIISFHQNGDCLVSFWLKKKSPFASGITVLVNKENRCLADFI